MHQFVDHGPAGLALQVPAEPFGVAVDVGAGGVGDAVTVGAELDGETTGGFVAVAGEHLDNFRVPLLQHRSKLLVGPVGQVGRGGGVDGDFVFPRRKSGAAGGQIGQERGVAVDDVDFAEEGVAEGVVGFGLGDVEEEIAELADGGAGVGDADAILSARLAVRRTAVDGGDELPAAGGRVGIAPRRGLEVGGGAVGSVELVHLRAASPGCQE